MGESQKTFQSKEKEGREEKKRPQGSAALQVPDQTCKYAQPHFPAGCLFPEDSHSAAGAHCALLLGL